MAAARGSLALPLVGRRGPYTTTDGSYSKKKQPYRFFGLSPSLYGPSAALAQKESRKSPLCGTTELLPLQISVPNQYRPAATAIWLCALGPCSQERVEHRSRAPKSRFHCVPPVQYHRVRATTHGI